MNKLWLPLLAVSFSAMAQTVEVYKSPTCGCCGKWVDYMQDNGFEVITHDLNDIVPIKKKAGVIPEAASCHTAIVDGYFIEGHVPADDVRRMLKEKPDIAGLAAPGMPSLSPGMNSLEPKDYDVISVDKGGKTAVYSSY